MRRWTALPLALVLFTAVATSAEAGSARQAIEATLGKFAAAFNGGDAKAVAALYTDDGALLPPDAPRVDGRPAIQEFWQGAIDAGLKDLVLEAVEIEGGRRGAHEVGRFTLTAPVEGGEPATLHGKYIVIWKLGDDGTWRLHRDIWNLTPAPKQ